MSQVGHQAEAYPGFCSMKWLGVFLLSLWCNISPSQDYHQPWGYSPIIPIVYRYDCASQRGLDFGTPELEWGIHFEMFPRTEYNISNIPNFAAHSMQYVTLR